MFTNEQTFLALGAIAGALITAITVLFRNLLKSKDDQIAALTKRNDDLIGEIGEWQERFIRAMDQGSVAHDVANKAVGRLKGEGSRD